MSGTPRRAVILAAGFGTRLRPLTDLCPKPLVKVNGIPILHNTLRNLAAVGVQEVTVVVGYRKDAIEYACGRSFSGIDIDYVESSVFDHTGSAYSLWMARETLLQGDCYLLEGDVFFETDALRRLATGTSGDTAAISPFEPSMEGSAVLLAQDGSIREVRMRQTARDASGADAQQLFKTMNLFCFSGGMLRSLMVPVLNDLIGSGGAKAYTEELLANLVERHGLKVEGRRCDDLRWYEIDTADDLRIAEALFAMPVAHVGSAAAE